MSIHVSGMYVLCLEFFSDAYPRFGDVYTIL